MKKLIIVVLSILFIVGVGYMFDIAGASNFGRLVLGEANFGEDPNVTADLTFQNDEYISNATDGNIFLSSVTISMSGTVRDTNVFVTTAESDTVTISGALATDIYFVSPRYTAGVDQQDVLQWKGETGKLIVFRLAAGESALKYSWLRIK